MTTPFSKTLAFLEAQERRSHFGPVALGGGVVLLGWALWLSCSRTTVYAASDEGRLVASGAASPIQAPVAGVIAETKLALGAEVEAGSVLVELDTSMERLRRDEEAERIVGLERAIESVDRILEATISREDTALATADSERARRDGEIRLLLLQREKADLKSRMAATRIAIAELDWEIGRRTLRAPVDGVVADVVALAKGAGVSSNQVLATVVPRATMRWVASFPVREAVGRLRPGQRVRIRLDAFPWTAYGALSGTVAAVGSEAHDQRVRVEVDVRETASIPLSHGMTGTTEVAIEDVSPLDLLLRLAGQRPERPASKPAGGAP